MTWTLDIAYEQLVELTYKLLANEHFIRLRKAFARALAVVPRLEAEDIDALCRAIGFPSPRPPGQLCNASP